MGCRDCRKVNCVEIKLTLWFSTNYKTFDKGCMTLYDTLGTAKDALFDLMDAVLVSACITSFVSLSQSPVFRRQWGSTYAALQDSRLPRGPVLNLLVQQIPTQQQPVLAGDVSRWQRPVAKTLKDRTFSGGTGSGITTDHSYSTLAWTPEESGSWALPLSHQRVTTRYGSLGP